MVNKIFKYFFLLCDILLLVYLVIYTIRDEVLEMFKFKMTKFTLIASDIISLSILSFYIKLGDISSFCKAFFLMCFYFIFNHFMYDKFNDIEDKIFQFPYITMLTLSSILSHFITIKEELYLSVSGGVLVESLFYSFFNTFASLTVSGAILFFFIFIFEFINNNFYIDI